MEITGILLHKLEEKNITDNFKTRNFVLKTDYNKEYPQEVMFELSNAKCELIDNIPLGVVVKIDFQLRGRKYTNQQDVDSWFNTLQVWKIEQVK